MMQSRCVCYQSAKDALHSNPQVSLSRAARTDAGVHAAGNLVSIKLITEVPGVADMATRINEELPPEIRVWKIVSDLVLSRCTH